MKIAAISSAHNPQDSRIFFKECVSLAQAGHRVTLFATKHGEDLPSKDLPVQLSLIRRPSSRGARFFLTAGRLIQRAIRDGNEILHFHDPEFLILVPFYRLFFRFTAIMDIHEDYGGSILKKTWIPCLLRPAFSAFYRFVEKFMLRAFDHIILAEDSYAKRFKKWENVTIIRNFSIVQTPTPSLEEHNRKNDLVYLGGIKQDRGVFEMLKLVDSLKNYRPETNLLLIGPFLEKGLFEKIQREIQDYNLQENVSLLGYRPLQEAKTILRECKVGLALLQATPNYRESIPTKILDYMEAGLLPISYSVPLWKQLIDTLGVGKTVPEKDSKALLHATLELLEQRTKLGPAILSAHENLVKNFSWKTEEKKLLELYRTFSKIEAK